MSSLVSMWPVLQFGRLLCKLLSALRCSPNIEGIVNNAAFDTANATGVFSVTKGSGSGGGTDIRYKNNVLFNSSNGNSLYSGEKLQFPALQVLICIKA